MCLYKTHILPKISREPITVYKILLYKKGEYYTPIIRKKVNIGQTIKSKWPWIFGIVDSEIRGAGVHAYTLKRVALDTPNYHEVLVEAEIPPFTPYWVGKFGEIAASKIKLIREII